VLKARAAQADEYIEALEESLSILAESTVATLFSAVGKKMELDIYVPDEPEFTDTMSPIEKAQVAHQAVIEIAAVVGTALAELHDIGSAIPDLSTSQRAPIPEKRKAMKELDDILSIPSDASYTAVASSERHLDRLIDQRKTDESRDAKKVAIQGELNATWDSTLAGQPIGAKLARHKRRVLTAEEQAAISRPRRADALAAEQRILSHVASSARTTTPARAHSPSSSERTAHASRSKETPASMGIPAPVPHRPVLLENQREHTVDQQGHPAHGSKSHKSR
jgi:hypothetical protein